MQPLYFLPERGLLEVAPGTVLSHAILAEHGIADTFSDVRGPKFGDCDLSECPSGPDGSRGVLMAYKRPDGVGPPPHYQPGNWKWEKARDNLWIGHQGNVTAEDLQRPDGFDGYHIPLAEMGEWCIPVIRRDDDSTTLPRAMYFDDAGMLVEPIRDKYRSFWDETKEVLIWHTQGVQKFDIDRAKAFRLSVRALTINYRFGMNEQRILQVVDSENFLTILGMTVDIIRIQEIAATQTEDAKKKESLNPEENTTNTTHGQPEDIPAIPQAAATCT